MKSPYFFIVTPVDGKRYSNISIIGGVEIIVSTNEENHEYTNRFAEVIETPLGYEGDIKKGTILVVHHNVMKVQSDIRGERKDGNAFFKENTFLIEQESFYLFNNGEGWRTVGRFCFVSPIKVIDDNHIKKFVENEPLMGEIKYSNPYLENNGVKTGDRICFAPDSEYIFHIEGETLYRCFDHQIVSKL